MGLSVRSLLHAQYVTDMRKASTEGVRPRRWAAAAAGITAALLVALAACSATVAPSTTTPVPTAAQRSERALEGQTKFIATGCAACHGERGEGGIGPRASGTKMRLADLQILVRSGDMNGVKYDYDELSDQDVANIYLWLQTNPSGTPIP